ncbi:MAG: amidophosphoribosyltransferase [Alteromonas naphthalenivorans]|jgi:amidophosphoribosyltransferase
MKHSLFFIFLSLFLYSSKTEDIGHECGFSFVKLKNNSTYYQNRYNNPLWGLYKTQLLLEKQRNRGQDGAGISAIQNNSDGVVAYRLRAVKPHPLETIFEQAYDQKDIISHSHTFLGHVRYGTYGKEDVNLCQPLIHNSPTSHHRLSIAGNFNLTNIPYVKRSLRTTFFNPQASDTQTVINTLAQNLQTVSNKKDLNFAQLIQQTTRHWDGGYAFCCVLGTGESVIFRDPHGIRPAFMYEDDEVIASASERAALIGAFNCNPEDIKEVPPGSVVHISPNNTVTFTSCPQKKKFAACAFEAIYFSRQEDPLIYQKRKQLGKALADRVLKSIETHLNDTVFCYIPNTGSVAFTGMMEKLETITMQKDFMTRKVIPKPLRKEHLINKNQQIRTFIAQEGNRSDLIEHMYNITKGIVQPHETVVALDDSIVRGATLQKSIIRQLINLNPKHIIIVSSAPPVKYPDCYGIDMSKIDDFIAFRALVSLIKKHGKEQILEQVEQECKAGIAQCLPSNPVQKLYALFSHQELEEEIAQLIYPHDTNWRGSIKVIYQTVSSMHKALEDYPGDWYFTGNYPTLGGYQTVQRSYLNSRMGSNKRSYE